MLKRDCALTHHPECVFEIVLKVASSTEYSHVSKAINWNQFNSNPTPECLS